MAFLRSLLLILFCSFTLSAQLVIEEVGSDSEDSRTVTLASDESSEDGKKNEWGAAFLSLAVPGTGHFYLGQKRKAAAYMSSDLLLLAGTIFSELNSRRMYKNSISYARSYAGTRSSRDIDDSYWNTIGSEDSSLLSSEQWNFLEAYRKRNFDARYVGDDTWEWISAEYKEEYNEQRSNASDWHSVSYFFIGGMIVNRLVSFVDARISAGRYNSNLISSLEFNTHYSLYDGTAGVTLSGAF